MLSKQCSLWSGLRYIENFMIELMNKNLIQLDFIFWNRQDGSIVGED